MTKFFNETMSLGKIVRCYNDNKFPNAYCILWNGDLDNALATESTQILLTENNKVVEIDGAEFSIH